MHRPLPLEDGICRTRATCCDNKYLNDYLGYRCLLEGAGHAEVALPVELDAAPWSAAPSRRAPPVTSRCRLELEEPGFQLDWHLGYVENGGGESGQNMCPRADGRVEGRRGSCCCQEGSGTICGLRRPGTLGTRRLSVSRVSLAGNWSRKRSSEARPARRTFGCDRGPGNRH